MTDCHSIARAGGTRHGLGRERLLEHRGAREAVCPRWELHLPAGCPYDRTDITGNDFHDKGARLAGDVLPVALNATMGTDYTVPVRPPGEWGWALALSAAFQSHQDLVPRRTRVLLTNREMWGLAWRFAGLFLLEPAPDGLQQLAVRDGCERGPSAKKRPSGGRILERQNNASTRSVRWTVEFFTGLLTCG